MVEPTGEIAFLKNLELRGAHEDLMNEAAERKSKGMAGQLAVMTAILATVGAIFSYVAAGRWLPPANDRCH